MKILLINKFLYRAGGDAVCTIETGNLLRSQGHEVIFWGMNHPDNPEYPSADLFIDNLDFLNTVGLRKQLNIAAKLLYSLEAKNKVDALIKRVGKPDIVHLHNFAHQISPSVLHIFKKYKIPVVMTMHDYKMVCAPYTLLSHGKVCELCKDSKFINCFKQECVKDSKAKSLLSTIEMYLHHKILKLYDLIDIYVSPSSFLKSKIVEMGFTGKVEHIPNFVKTEIFPPSYDWQEKSIYFLGRLSHEKGILTLIEAVKELDVTLKIIGDGPLRLEVENIIKTEKISNVKLLGYMSSDQLRDEMSKSMFMVIPSEWYENNPMSVIESFALGKPVIGARIGGIPELVRDNFTGLTYESRNIKDLSYKIKTLLFDEDSIKVYGQNARSYVEKTLCADVHYEKLMKVYTTAINNK
ncbi:MAG: glycosyltransferase family 4 protein [archaeon]|nr:glycosyltransferase family 4 protein [archaeon]